MQITKMEFDGSSESSITPKSELLTRRDTVEKPKEARNIEQRPRSASRAASKQQMRRRKPVPPLIADKPLEMKPTGTPFKVQRPLGPPPKVQGPPCSIMSSRESKQHIPVQQDKLFSPERMRNYLKLGRLSQATLSTRSSEPKIKRKMSTREKVSEISVAPNMNTIKVQMSGNEGSEFVCHNVPHGHTLTIKSQQFYDQNGHLTETLKSC